MESIHVMEDGILMVEFVRRYIEKRPSLAVSAPPHQIPKGALLHIRFKGERRTLTVSRERGEQALSELLP